MAKFDFEKAMAKLEEIVADLESGELSLEESIKAFEEGVELSKKCHKKILSQLIGRPMNKGYSPISSRGLTTCSSLVLFVRVTAVSTAHKMKEASAMPVILRKSAPMRPILEKKVRSSDVKVPGRFFSPTAT